MFSSMLTGRKQGQEQVDMSPDKVRSKRPRGHLRAPHASFTCRAQTLPRCICNKSMLSQFTAAFASITRQRSSSLSGCAAFVAPHARPRGLHSMKRAPFQTEQLMYTSLHRHCINLCTAKLSCHLWHHLPRCAKVPAALHLHHKSICRQQPPSAQLSSAQAANCIACNKQR